MNQPRRPEVITPEMIFVEYTPWLYPLQPVDLACMDIRDTFARNLRIARKEKGYSQEELAHRAGLDRTYISSLERAVYNATIDVVDRIAVALNTEASALLERPKQHPASEGTDTKE